MGRARNTRTAVAGDRFAGVMGARRGLSSTQLQDATTIRACARWFELYPNSPFAGGPEGFGVAWAPAEFLVEQILNQEKLNTSESERLRGAVLTRVKGGATDGEIDRAVMRELAQIIVARHSPDARAAHMRRMLGPDIWWSTTHQVFPQALEPTTRAVSPLQHLSAERYKQMWREGLMFHDCRPLREELRLQPGQVGNEIANFRHFLGNALVRALTNA